MADVTGTNNNDLLFFQGTMGHLTTAITNDYSGETLLIDDDYNINDVSYDGLAGIDTLFMTNVGDAFFITNGVGQQMLANIERIIAGDGGDLIILSHNTITLGNTFIDGGASDDVIWANAGDDTVRGFDGDDILDGGPGNDAVLGQGGDDKVGGGAGNDILNGGAGADILSGGAGDDTLQFITDIVFPSGVFAQNMGSPGIDGTNEFKSANGTNGTFDIFDGGDGFDTVVMTTGNDTLFLYDPFHTFNSDGTALRLISIEKIDAGAGNDIVDLTSQDVAYDMDIIVLGGVGNDLIWTSTGNDTLDGGDGVDSLYGGVGNDILYGGAGNDRLIGGPNADSGAVQITTVSHDFSNDVVFPNLVERVDILDLVPPGDNALGIAAGDLSVDYSTTAAVSFVRTEAGFDNSLGFYNIKQDGTIDTVKLAFPNVKSFAAGDSATIDLPGAPDTDFGFFIIANGANKNNDFSNYDLINGEFHFIYKHNKAGERLASIHDDAKDISLVYTNGSVEKVVVGSNNHIYHTTLRGGDTNLNPDGEVHTVSGLITDGDTTSLRIGFEDLPNLGDADYNDVVFDITVASQSTTALVVDDNDILYGGAGDDIIDGGVGDDILFGQQGADTLYGEQGSDVFAFDVMDGFVDTIKDFEVGAGGDALNITDILQGFDELTDLLNDFVRLADSGGNTEVQVNADGDAGGIFTAIAIIEGGLGGATLADLVNNGNLVANQSAV
ncbi:MAG: DUF4114 domain-containing protein [Proteobacteria bacterium]|nr:DUF4114 domain-containing protein [Pseudomonadota bacterium]